MQEGICPKKIKSLQFEDLGKEIRNAKNTVILFKKGQDYIIGGYKRRTSNLKNE